MHLTCFSSVEAGQNQAAVINVESGLPALTSSKLEAVPNLEAASSNLRQTFFRLKLPILLVVCGNRNPMRDCDLDQPQPPNAKTP